VLAEPHVEVEGVVLLGPQHPCQRLTHDHRPVRVQRRRRDRCVELIGLRLPQSQYVVEVRERVGAPGLRRGEAQVEHDLSPAGHERLPVGRDLRAAHRVHRVGVTVHDRPVDPVLDVRRRVGLSPQSFGVRLVLAEEQVGVVANMQPVVTDPVMMRPHARPCPVHHAQRWFA
jgi:hypothetical protein